MRSLTSLQIRYSFSNLRKNKHFKTHNSRGNMSAKSWIVTLSPLAIALGTTVKSFLTGESLNESEVELIKYLMGTFVASGAIGAYLKTKGK
jgi:hypothetical protein